jgi:hypothetical protein
LGWRGHVLLLRLLVGELEASLWRHIGHRWLQGIEGSSGRHALVLGYHAHVGVLLLCSLEVLLLLLQQLDLLLYSKLFHWLRDSLLA